MTIAYTDCLFAHKKYRFLLIIRIYLAIFLTYFLTYLVKLLSLYFDSPNSSNNNNIDINATTRS